MFLCLFLLLAAFAHRALCADVSLRLFPSCVSISFPCLRVLIAVRLKFPDKLLLGCGFPVVDIGSGECDLCSNPIFVTSKPNFNLTQPIPRG